MPSRKRLPDPRAARAESAVEALRGFLQDHPVVRTVRVAFSGGLDSTVLLHVAASLRVSGLEAMHVDHGLRPDSPRQAKHCGDVAASLGCPFLLRTVTVGTGHGQGVEAAAREARYAALREGLGQGDLILSAQHADDQAETFLLAALRGSGPEGLQAMRALRREGDTWLGRPFLGLARDELKAYADHHGLAWYDDPTNADSRFDRNFLRQKVMPALRERFDVPGSLARSAHWQQEAMDQRDQFFAGQLAVAQASVDHSLDLRVLRRLNEPEQRGLLRYWLRQRGIRPPGHHRLSEFLRQTLEGALDATPALEWDEGWMRRYRDAIFAGFSSDSEGALTIADRPWPADQEVMTLADGRRLMRADLPAMGVDPGTALIVSYRSGGELVATECGHRSLKKLMQERGIPPWERHRVPLLRQLDGIVVAVYWPQSANARS